MFHMIEFENIESEETQDLMFSLNGIPNGTILSYGIIVYRTENKWFVWFEDDINERFQSLYYSFSKTKGIKRFLKLYIIDSIHNSEWKWEDEYIKEVFDNFLDE